MPFSTPHTMLAAVGRRLEEFAATLGIDLPPLARGVGIDPALLGKPDVRISLGAFMRLMHLLEIVSNDDCIGLRYAVYFRRGDSGPFGFAILHAPNLREALRIYRSYQRIVADHTFFDLTEDAREVTVRWRYSRLLDYPAQYTDLHAALMLKILRSFMGPDWYPKRVEFLRSRPKFPGLHQAYFGPDITFNAAMNNVVFSASLLDSPAAAADPRLFEMMEKSCQASLAEIERTKDMRLQLREHIMSVLPMGQANLPRISAEMGLGERSLQRRLAELGTSFEKQVEETRRDLSDRLLVTDTPLSEISYLCGYSNASAYSRAAKAWYGVAPQEFRKSLRK